MRGVRRLGLEVVAVVVAARRVRRPVRVHAPHRGQGPGGVGPRASPGRPAGRSCENLKDVFAARDDMLVTAFRNSIILTVVSVALLVVLCAMVGFVLQRRPGPLANVANLLVLSGLIIPPAVVPTIFVLQKLGLFKTLPGLILVEVAFSMPFSRAALPGVRRGHPAGARRGRHHRRRVGRRLFFRVIFPLLRPVIDHRDPHASVAIYNDFVNPLYFLPGNENATVQLTLFNFQSQFNTQWNLLFMDILLITDPAADPVHLLQPQDRLGLDGRLRSRAEAPVAYATNSHVVPTGESDDQPGSCPCVHCARSGSRSRPGPTATRAPGSRCSRRRACRATRTRRSPTRRPVHRFTGVAPTRGAAHPVGPGRRLRASSPRTRRTSASRSAPSTPTSSRTTTTCSAASPTRTRGVRRKAIDHLLECVDIMDATGSRDLKLWFSDGTNYPGPGRHARPAGPARRGAARGVRPARRRPADAAGVQALRAGVLHDRRARLGHRVRALPRARRAGARSSSTPATTRPGTNIEFIVAFLLRAGQARRLRLQLPLLRRRRPHGRRGRPVPAVPDHARGRARRRLDPSDGIAVHARPVPQHRAEDPGHDPLGDERAGGDGQGAARRRTRRWRAAQRRRRRAGRQRRADGRLQHRRPAAAARAARGAWASTPTRSAAYQRPPATLEQDPRRARSAARQAGWGA